MNKEKSAFEIFEQNLGSFLRQNDKLTVVFASLMVILIGIVAYLIYNESRIKKLEDKLKNKS